MMKKLLFTFLMLVSFSLSAQPVKVACVGNSVTYGMKLDDPATESYPAQLQQLLGDGYVVGNFGKNGATLLRKGYRPYNEQEEYRSAIEFAGDIVIIHLGLNDTDPRDWPNYGDEFIGDYLTLIEDFKRANPSCRVLVCRMTPIGHRHWRFKSGTRDWYWKIQHAIEQVALQSGCQLIDLQDVLYHRPELFPDALHPNKEGAGIIARQVYEAITGDFGGLQMPEIYADNMVLQRDIALTISGKANAGEMVSVALQQLERKKAKPIQTASAVAASDGRWQVTLEPMPAGSGYELWVSTDTRRLTFKNVAIGEVWLCSGQSNMAFRMNQSAQEEQEAFGDYVAKGTPIRLFLQRENWLTNEIEWSASACDSVNRLLYFQPATWACCNADNFGDFSAVALQFGKMLADSLNVPIGLIQNALGGSTTESWIDRKTLEFDFPDVLYDWKNGDFGQEWARSRAKCNTKLSDNALQRHPYEPCYLFESAILPLAHFPVRGAIWYQGESNAHNIETHERLFALLVQSWRAYFGGTMPFYFVQLSSLNRPSWPAFRDSQRMLLQKIEGTGMAVSSDCGHPSDVHPTQKQAVGQRLALWALHDTYRFNLVPSGPLFKSFECKEGAVFVNFDYADGLHSSDGEVLRTFEVAEMEGRFVPAKAEVVGNQVKVWSETLKNPKYVRYGWQPYTEANLVNGAGLPASTFKGE